MDDQLIYRKTRRGATELAATHGALSTASRRVLILLDGRRTLAELEELFGAESVEHVVSELEAQGFARIADPDDALTTQSFPDLTELRQPPAPTETLPSEAAPRGRGLGWIALLLVASASASGYWFVVHGDRKTDPTDAMAVPNDVYRTPPAITGEDPGGSTPPDSPQAVREVALSGLPPITVTSASARAAAPALAAADSPAQARRPPERPAAPVPEAKPTPEVEAPPPSPVLTAPAPAPPPPSPAPVAHPVAVAVAETTQPGRSVSDAPPVLAPASPPAASVPALLPVLPAPSAAPAPAPGGATAGKPAEQMAALAPAARPRSEPVALHPRQHAPPEYPPRALRARILDGYVKARIWVNAEGSVEQVDILKATPPRVFDDEVKRALSAWTFDPPGQATDTTVELTFKP